MDEIVFKKCKDSDPSTVELEISLFLERNIGKLVINPDGAGLSALKAKKISIGGDNLITRKQMDKRVNHLRKARPETENADEFYAYLILPYIIGDRQSSVNIYRSITSGYNDNPFAFLVTLNGMYKSDFKNYIDNAERAIIKTKEYWKIFGKGKEGFNTFLKVFCLQSGWKLGEEEKYKQYFSVRNYEEEDWEGFCNLLDEFAQARQNEMAATLKGS